LLLPEGGIIFDDMRMLVSAVLAAVGILSASMPLTAKEAANDIVYVISVKEDISRSTVYLVRRGLNEAAAAGARAVVVDMDTFGGRVDSAESIMKLLNRAPSPVYTYVDTKAISAGALISAATDKIYMAPGSVIGDAAPIMVTPGEGAKDVPPTLKEKMNSGLRALVRSVAQENGHNPEVFEAMIDPDLELKIGDKMICEKGRLLTLTHKEAEQLVGDPPKSLLSAGTKDSLDAVLKAAHLDGMELRKVEPHGFEVLARWIEPIAPLLIGLGFLAIIIEFYTPGIGIPSIGAAICFGIFFIGYFAAGLAGWEDVALFVIGLVLLAIEVFVIPGFGVVGILGIGLILTSLLMTMTERWPGGPILPAVPDLVPPLMNLGIGIVVAAVAGVIVVRYLPRTTLFKGLELATELNAKQGFSSGGNEWDHLVGATGVAETALRPSGKGRFDGQYVDVATDGDLIDKGTAIRITRVEGSRVYVDRAG
jgi:membrane-bound serine protease (ClpP class)